MKYKNFTIDECYLNEITTERYISHLANPENPTDEDLILILKGRDRTRMTGSADHPEFAKLRQRLGREGFIEIEDRWWNGDRVLKPFYLNGLLFKKDEQFACAAAMKGHLSYRKSITTRKRG